MKTTVVNIKFDEYDVKIGRPSKWGNPFSHLKNSQAKFKVSTIDEAVDEYEKWIVNQPELMASLHELEGKRLGCFCVDKNGNGKCHGKVLVKLIDASKYKSLF